jgi:hypothetical protein
MCVLGKLAPPRSASRVSLPRCAELGSCLSVAGQESECRTLAAEHGLTVRAVNRDNDITASDKGPAFRQADVANRDPNGGPMSGDAAQRPPMLSRCLRRPGPQAAVPGDVTG